MPDRAHLVEVFVDGECGMRTSFDGKGKASLLVISVSGERPCSGASGLSASRATSTGLIVSS